MNEYMKALASIAAQVANSRDINPMDVKSIRMIRHKNHVMGMADVRIRLFSSSEDQLVVDQDIGRCVPVPAMTREEEAARCR